VSEHFTLKLQRSHMLAPSVRHMVFARGDEAALHFTPGQFLQIHFPWDGKTLRRSYSVATYPGDPHNPEGFVEMAISYVDGGAATVLLSGMQSGDSVEASGPYGRFCLHDNDSNARYLLIATGTGVTPYRAMLPQLERLIASRGVEVCLLFGARTERELLYGDEFAAFAQRVPGFRFFPCFSRREPRAERDDDRKGHVQDLLPELKPDAARDIAYLCGNPNMVDACFAVLKDAGLPIPNIRREKYVSPPDPKGKTVPMATE
jgi:ferredoxin-NADP reductase